MATIIFNQNANLRTSGIDERLATGAGASFFLSPDLAGSESVTIEDIIIVRGSNRALFKGVVEDVKHSLTGENVEVQCIGVDQYVDSQPWQAFNRYYNDPEVVCGDQNIGLTLQDFFDAEWDLQVGEDPGSRVVPADWFVAYDLPVPLQALPLPAINTFRKGFLTVLQEIVAAHPFISWAIEFDKNSTTIFPVGTLRIIDLREATNTHQVYIGDVPAVNGLQGLNFETSLSAAECAKHVHVFARGRFVERFELATPNWDAKEERLHTTGLDVVYGDTWSEIDHPRIEASPPETEDDTLSLPDGFGEHIYGFTIRSKGVSPRTHPDSPGIITNFITLWPGADYEINTETGEIRFLKPEEGEEWWWVNNDNGTIVVAPDRRNPSGLTLNLNPLRRPIAFDNDHLTAEVYQFYTWYMGENPYRAYKVSRPIADLRLRRATVAGEEIIRKETTSIDVFIPKIAANGRFEVEKRASNTALGVSFDSEGNLTADFIGQPGSADITNYKNLFGQFNDLLGSTYEDYGTPEYEEPEVPLITARMLWPRVSVTPTEKEVRRFFTETSSSVSFEEGTPCLFLSERQLLAQPLWWDIPIFDGIQVRPINPDRFTWPLLVRYTSWEEEVEYRNTLYGGERHYRGVFHSALHYEDITQDPTTPEVIFNSIDGPDGVSLVSLADETAEYLGTPYWIGTLTILLEWDHVEEEWKSPVRIGDHVKLNGKVSAQLQTAFEGIVTGISYNTENFTATLVLGRREPRTNPFLPRRPLATDIEGDRLTGEGQSGLAPLGGSQ